MVLIYFVVPVAAFLAGVFMSQKIKDTIHGVPAALRADLAKVEAAALGKLKG